MKQTRLLILASLAAICLAACATTVTRDQYAREIAKQGFVPYNNPSGDTSNPKDWGKFGPGAILRKKQQTHYESANTLLGDAGVTEAMKPDNSSPIGLFSGKTVSGYEYDAKSGWTIDDANKIAAAANLKKDKTVEIRYGNSFIASYRSEGDMHRDLSKALPKLNSTARKALRRGEFIIVLNAIYTDKISYTFKQTAGQSGEITYKLTDQEVLNLKAKGYTVVDNSIEISQPRFIAYLPLQDAKSDIPDR